VISDIVQFKLFVKQEMEARLTEFPAQHVEDLDGDVASVKIALTTFAFDNAEVINDLKRRGKYIRYEKWAKLE
jgi:orotidine-5'-phosphate decarboxylase